MQTIEDAKKALKHAEHIIETSYAITKEVKLLPLALKELQKAIDIAWQTTKEKDKPKLLEKLEKLIKEKKDSQIEFQRKQKLILWKKDNHITSIDEHIIKEYITKTKRYLETCKTKTQHEKN